LNNSNPFKQSLVVTVLVMALVLVLVMTLVERANL
jgi:hypothetical protein